MDGTTSGNGAGPRIMEPTRKDVILASGDQVAIDAVAAKLMGFDPLSIPYIKIAHEAGVGVGDPREIELVGDAAIGNESWGFKVGKTFHSFLAYLAWYGPTKFLQKLIFHTPIVHLPNLVSETYHDYYRWTFREKKIYEQWLHESPWGGLFSEYKEKGILAAPRVPVTAGD